MKHSTGKPTKAEATRMAALKDMQCVACRQRGWVNYFQLREIHHLLSGNKRRGHLFTIPLCAWHHRGIVFTGPFAATKADMVRVLGPSLAYGSKPFHAEFGTDDELLALTDSILEKNPEHA